MDIYLISINSGMTYNTKEHIFHFLFLILYYYAINRRIRLKYLERYTYIEKFVIQYVHFFLKRKVSLSIHPFIYCSIINVYNPAGGVSYCRLLLKDIFFRFPHICTFTTSYKSSF